MQPTDEIGHLSIGEVLSLLQAEFPDVTISKIRFLEAQGLIDPERTPSGYRKFYELDIVRLRWILRQQRDNFLPLKVIKAKLEGGDVDFDAGVAVQQDLWGEQPAAVAAPVQTPWTPKVPGRDRPESRADTDVVGAAAAAGVSGRSSGEPAMTAPAGDERRRPAVGAPRSSKHPTIGASGGPGPDVGGPTSESSSITRTSEIDVTETVVTETVVTETVVTETDVAVAETVIDVAAAGSAAPDMGADARSSGVAGRPTSPDSTPSSPDSSPGSPGSSGSPGVTPEHPDDEHDAAAWLLALQESPRRGAGPAAASRPAGDPAPGLARGVRFGLAEVVEVTGVEGSKINEMISYGLVAPTVIGGEATFDAYSVSVVRAVAAFLARGVEPRHLRMFKNAADREAGFYEQMILPLLKQRNPKAREQASSTLAELAAAGDELGRALVRQALRAHLDD